jgi:hypothetical protein
VACPGPSRCRYASLLGIAVWLLAGSTRAEEPVLARVQSIESGRVTLTIDDSGSRKPTQVRVTVDGAELPPGVAPGRLVRLWPGSSPVTGGALAGARLSPLAVGQNGSDRTGVRARLMQGAGRGFGGGRGGR